MRRRRRLRCRRWRPPNNPTLQARLVWAALFPRESWPKGWRVEWVGFMRGALGLTLWSERRILLSYGDAVRRGYPVSTLIHEFVHVRAGRRFRHGKEFKTLEHEFRSRLGLGPRDEETKEKKR
jgi:hypothetical protein